MNYELRMEEEELSTDNSQFAIRNSQFARRGSALLIVLGMLAFMVISAVAFSAYMRYSRLPSSFLRRSSASRLLVKAALAEAIDEIDAAIGNNPHPGIGTRAPRTTAGLAATGLGGLNSDLRTRNHWRSRVYIGTNQLYSAEDTVSTLTLEGLAYIPPPLVNEARYYSRRSTAGQWRKLGFDSGRYAFCAIDVSDFFDVNALLADNARSSAPGSRISLAYLFENAAHTSASGSSGSPSAWDNFMKQFTDDKKVPLVSMADWNLAVNQDSPGGLMSQFCQYIRENRTSFYGGIGETGAAADAIRNQAFVTDSWFPPQESYSTSAGGSAQKVLDLGDERYQPFSKGELRSKRSLIQIADENLANEEAFKRLEQCIDALGFCALYDYLDANDEPLSLAIPTLERVPMICGLSPDTANAPLTVVPNVVINNQIAPVGGTKTIGGQYTITLQVKYEIQGLPTPALDVLAVYPFRHEDAKNSNNYEIGGRLSYFLSFDDDPVGLRTRNANDVLHVANDSDRNLSSYKQLNDAVLSVGLSTRSVAQSTFDGNNQGPIGAVKKFNLRPAGMFPSKIEILDVTYEGTGTYQDDGNGNPVPNPNHSTIDLTQGDKATQATCAWQPVDASGKISADFAAGLLNTLNNAGYSKKLRLNLGVWAWVKSGTQIVDMAPACVYDDELNGRNTDNRSRKWGQDRLGMAYPLMRFDMAAGGASLLSVNSANVQSVLGAGDATQMAVTPQSAMVCDPRYNHAPESWFALSAQLNEQTWFDNCNCGYKTRNENGYVRDGDIFLSVSDNEELQSVYELANLPRFTAFYSPGAVYGSKNMWYAAPDAGNRASWKSFTSAVTDTANFNLMWRTYDPFDCDEGRGFEDTGIVSDRTGYRVTPFSNITNVMMAAFANTPYEWRLSSANEQTMQNVPDKPSTFNARYAWNAYSSGARIDWEDLEDLCGAFMWHMKNANGTRSWEDVWLDDLNWCDYAKSGEENSKYLLLPDGGDTLFPNGLELGETSNRGRIWNCDRKFLYGYWHDCFAVRQQLFLVFVRAEPSMMGGGARGQTPPQLGARAVALVWRDPASSPDERTPHRTRILFYRQFD